MINYNFKIDTASARTMYTDAVFTSGDVRGYRLNFSFYDEGKERDVSECVITIKAKRADGVLVTDIGITNDKGAYYDVKSSMISAAGELSFEIALSSEDGMYVTTKELIANVREGHGEGGVTAEDVSPVLSSVLSASQNAQKSAKAAEETAAQAAESAKNAREILSSQETLFANVINDTKCDTVIRIDDASPVRHVASVQAESKNVIPYPYMQTTKTTNGITFEDMGDGSIRMYGTATANVQFVLVSTVAGLRKPIKKGTYFLSCPEITNKKIPMFIYLYNDNTSSRYSNAVAHNEVVEIPEDMYYGLYLTVTSGMEIDLLTIHPQLERGTAATEFTPYVDTAEGNIYKYGKNLIPFPYSIGGASDSVTENGVTLEIQQSGGIKVTRNEGSQNTFLLAQLPPYLFPKEDLSGLQSATDGVYTVSGDGVSVDTYGTVWLSIDDTTDESVIYPQLEAGTTETEYEMYKEPEVSSMGADDTERVITLDGSVATLVPDKYGATVTCTYNQDTNKVVKKLKDAIAALGGEV